METTGNADRDQYGRGALEKRSKYRELSPEELQTIENISGAIRAGLTSAFGYLAGQKAFEGNAASAETPDSGNGTGREDRQATGNTLRKALISLLETAYHEEHIIPFPGYVERLDAILQEYFR